MPRRPLQHAVTLAAGAGLVLVNRAALRAGFRRRADGWRRAAGLMLRGEASHFVLSALGLGVCSNGQHSLQEDAAATAAHIAQRLAEFLKNEPAAHVRIRTSRAEDIPESASGPCYTLSVVPSVRGPARFIPPEAWDGKPASATALPPGTVPLLNFVCRTDDRRTVDIWARVNHVGADGVPIQELLSRLENAWGQPEPVVYPTPEEFAPFEAARALPGRPELSQIQAFIDFAPLLAWRSRQNAGLSRPMTVGAALQWCLGHHPRFARMYMGSTVEVAPCGGLERGVGVVVVRPADYSAGRDGLERYVRDFNRSVKLTRDRASGSCKTLDALAFVPAGIATTVLRGAIERGGSAFGSLGLTILKDARVFVAPIGDTPHADGFISLGSLSLPTASGRPVGCVWIKGPRDRINGYPADIRAALREYAG